MDRLSQSQQMLWKRELAAYKFEFLAVLESNLPSKINKDIEQLITLRQQLSSSDDIVLTDHGMKKYDSAYTNILNHVKSYSEQEDHYKHSLFETVNKHLSGIEIFYYLMLTIILLIVLSSSVYGLLELSQYNSVIIGLLFYATWQITIIAITRIKYLGIIATSTTQFSIKYIYDLVLVLAGLSFISTIVIEFLSSYWSFFTTDDGAIIMLTIVAITARYYRNAINKEHKAIHWLCEKDKL